MILSKDPIKQLSFTGKAQHKARRSSRFHKGDIQSHQLHGSIPPSLQKFKVQLKTVLDVGSSHKGLFIWLSSKPLHRVAHTSSNLQLHRFTR